jgi:hypothetical protein
MFEKLREGGRGKKTHWVFRPGLWTVREAKALLASLPVSYEVLKDSRYSRYLRFRVTPNLGHELTTEATCRALFMLVPDDEAADLLAGRDGKLPFKRTK